MKLSIKRFGKISVGFGGAESHANLYLSWVNLILPLAKTQLPQRRWIASQALLTSTRHPSKTRRLPTPATALLRFELSWRQGGARLAERSREQQSLRRAPCHPAAGAAAAPMLQGNVKGVNTREQDTRLILQHPDNTIMLHIQHVTRYWYTRRYDNCSMCLFRKASEIRLHIVLYWEM